MTAHSHRASPEAAAWIGAAVLVAGLSLTSSLPGALVPPDAPRTLATAAETLRSALGVIQPGPQAADSAFLRPDCIAIRTPDPRELAAVLRGAYTAYPGAHIAVRWAGEYPRAVRAVVVCEP